MANRTVSVGLILDVRRWVSGAQQATKATRDFRSELASAAAKGDLDAVAGQATAAGIALTGAFAGITLTAATFDKAMSSVSAATLASASDMEKLREAALQAGADTAFSATEAAEGIEELAKAGVGTADILGGGLAGALDLAAAGQIGVGEAAETAASAMTQFNLAGTDVTHIADLLAAGAGKAQGSVGDMAMALKQGGLVAAQTGLSIEETAGTLAAFASAGLLGSDAGTSFKTMLLRLAAPTGKAAELMNQLGISAFDANGQFVGMSKFAGVLQQALAGMSQQQRQATLSTIFGTDAIRSASIIYQQGERGIQGWIDATNDQGFAAETAQRKLDNLMGDVEELTGSLETLAIESGSGANAGLRILTQTATLLVNQFGELPPVISGTAVVLTGLTGVLLLAFAAWVKMSRANALALAELRATGPAGAAAATGIQRTTRWAGRAAAGFVALQLASAALDAMLGDDLNPQIDALATGLERWTRSGAASGEAARLLGDDFEKLQDAIGAIGDEGFWADVGNAIAGGIEGILPFLKDVDDSAAKTRERIEAVDSALAQIHSGGNADAAAESFAQIAAMAQAEGVSLERLLEIFPQYAAALETAEGESDNAAAGMSEIAGAASEAAGEVEELTEAFEDLFDITMSLHRAEIDLRDGMAELIEELDKGTETLDINTQAGRDNQSATLDQIENIKDLREANIANGMAMDDANQLYQDQLTEVEKVLVKRGFEKDLVRALIDEYRGIPQQVTTTVSTPGLDAAAKKLDELRRGIDNIDRDIDINVSLSQSGAAPVLGGSVAFRHGGILAAQSGRLVPAHITGSPTVMYGERATGREAYVPMHGDPARSLTILAEAASWYGMAMTRPMPHSAPAAHTGGPSTVNVNVAPYSGQFSLKQVMDDLAYRGAV